MKSKECIFITNYVFANKNKKNYSFTIDSLYNELKKHKDVDIKKKELKSIIKSWVELGSIKNNLYNYTIRKTK